MMTKNLSKKVMLLLLAFVMAFGMLITPNIAEAADADINKTEVGSYIKAQATGVSDKDYVTITTLGGGTYGKVVRGNIFLTYPQGTNLTAVPVTFTAQKGFGFTLAGITVNPGESVVIPLNLTQENIATLNVSSDYDEGTYVITGAEAGEKITVTMEINVDNPRNWLNGTYTAPQGYTAPDLGSYSGTADIQNAIGGFDGGNLIDIYNVDAGTSAMDILKRFGQGNDMNITGIPQGYISYMGRNSYKQIGEFDINNYSGWMYTVDEGDGWYFPNVGASAKSLTKDTEMIWHFTMAYGADIGAPWGAPNGDPGMPLFRSMNRLNRLTIGDIVPQWSNSGRQLEAVK